MRFLTYGNVISSFIFIAVLLSELLVYVSNEPIVFSGMNQRSTTHQGEYLHSEECTWLCFLLPSVDFIM